MNKTNENTPRADARDDIIVLGVASVETKGGNGTQEFMGNEAGIGLVDE